MMFLVLLCHSKRDFCRIEPDYEKIAEREGEFDPNDVPESCSSLYLGLTC